MSVFLPPSLIVDRLCWLLYLYIIYHSWIVSTLSQAHFATVKISSVSFCTLDPKNKKLFAFINRKKRRNFCHVFQCNEHDVSHL